MGQSIRRGEDACAQMSMREIPPILSRNHFMTHFQIFPLAFQAGLE